MQSIFQKYLFLIAAFSLILISCDTNNPFEFVPPDYSPAPDRFVYDHMEKMTIQDGIYAYILEEGSDFPEVTHRDNLLISLTLRIPENSQFSFGRTQVGNIIYSTYQLENEGPESLRVSPVPGSGQSPVESYAHTDGLKSGLIGMKIGEKRTIIVEPEQGFGTGTDTLQYDIILHDISSF